MNREEIGLLLFMSLPDILEEYSLDFSQYNFQSSTTYTSSNPEAPEAHVFLFHHKRTSAMLRINEVFINKQGQLVFRVELTYDPEMEYQKWKAVKDGRSEI